MSSTETVEIPGGSGLPAGLWQIRTTYEFSVLQVRSDQVRVLLLPAWFGRVLALLFLLPRRPELAPYADWTVGWDDIDHVVATDRSVVMYPRVGRACWFTVRKKSLLDPLRREFDRRGIDVRRTRTNFFRSMVI